MTENSILDKPLASISFADVERFCDFNKPNSTTLQYAPSFRFPYLSQHIAAMANTFGGLLIIGVSFDSNTGKPYDGSGIKLTKDIQAAVNILMGDIYPMPRYRLKITDDQAGRVFVLIRLFEGDYGPYHISIDPHTVWIRSGKITESHEVAVRSQIHNIILKRRRAERSADKHYESCGILFENMLSEADIERSSYLNAREFTSVYNPALNDNQVLIKLFIEPSASTDNILSVSPKYLGMYLPNIKAQYPTESQQSHFPETKVIHPIPGGASSFAYYDSGDIYNVCSDQFYTNGVIFHAHNILQRSEFEPLVYVSTIALEIYDFLEAICKLYSTFDYNGELRFKVGLEGCKGYGFMPIIQHDYQYNPTDIRYTLLNDYSWTQRLNTLQLGKKQELLKIYHELIEKISWDLRLTDYYTGLTENMLKTVGRLESTD